MLLAMNGGANGAGGAMGPAGKGLGGALCVALAVVGCTEPKPIHQPEVRIPAELQVGFVNDRHRLHVYSSSVVISRGGPEYRLVVLEGRREGDGYIGVRMGRAWLDGTHGWEHAPIEGTIRFEGDHLEIALAGDEAELWNGAYDSVPARERRAREEREARAAARGEAEGAGEAAGENEGASGSAMAAPAAGTCQRYRDCACALAASPNGAAFREACDTATRLLRTAPDDPASCSMGLTLHRQLAAELGLMPPACRP